VTANPWLVAAGALSAAAAVLHLLIIAGGPGWYRLFGAGERLARAAERGSPVPALWAAAIAGVLAIWAAYAWAGVIPRLPLIRAALAAITAVYLLRGLVLAPALAAWLGGAERIGRWSPAFMVWSSLIVLGIGLLYAVGTWRAWPALSRPA
jgi:hypothetical protein